MRNCLPETLLAVAMFAFAGCDKAATATPEPIRVIVAGNSTTTSAGAMQSGASPSIDSGLAPTTELRPPTAKLKRAAVIGHTSLVLKLEFDNGDAFAFKPSSVRSATRYRGEIAAFRFAGALGIRSVPRALATSFPRAELDALLSPENRAELRDEKGHVHGACIPWIRGLKFPPMEREPMRSEQLGWLRSGAAVPDDRKERAADLSTMIVFDVLIGNWDRWSGGNVGESSDGRILFIDQDGAFFSPVPEGAMKPGRAAFANADRFSRRFVATLRELKPFDANVFGVDSNDQPLLGPTQLKELNDRVEQTLAAIDAKLSKNGEAETLYFP